MLVAASREVGGAQIQNRGTLGGNIANASPAGDTLPVLAAADAARRPAQRTRRSAPCRSTSFYTGYRTSVRQPDELIVADRDSRASTAANGGARSAPGARRRSRRS